MNGVRHYDPCDHTSTGLDDLPSWEQCEDAVDGFDHFMAMLPNLSPQHGNLEQTETFLNPSFGPVTYTNNSSSDKTSSHDRTKLKNNAAQRRFRAKQKVC